MWSMLHIVYYHFMIPPRLCCEIEMPHCQLTNEWITPACAQHMHSKRASSALQGRQSVVRQQEMLYAGVPEEMTAPQLPLLKYLRKLNRSEGVMLRVSCNS